MTHSDNADICLKLKYIWLKNICLKNDITGNRYVHVVHSKHAKLMQIVRSFELEHILECLTKGDTRWGHKHMNGSQPFINTLSVLQDGKYRIATVIYDFKQWRSQDVVIVYAKIITMYYK